MGDFDELTEFDVEVYRSLLVNPGCTLSALAADLHRSVEPITESLRALADIGLVHTAHGGRLSAVSPMLAEAVALGAEDLDLSARRATLEARRNNIHRLVPEWVGAVQRDVVPSAVDVVEDQNEIGNVLMHYADHCRDELLSVAPGRLPRTRVDSRTRIANLYGLRRGIRTRALYQHAALRDRHTRSYLSELADNGARIRFAPSVPGRSLVVDGEVALLPIPTDSGPHGLAIVRDTNVVSWIIATFEQLWAEATPMEDLVNRSNDDPAMDETRAAILRLMAEGEKDEAISRRLSISVRTCRRHIAEYMLQVGANSRFQAGVIAARAGHADLNGGG